MEKVVKRLRKVFTEPHHLIKTKDGATLFLREWIPSKENEKDVAVLIFHGITAYSGPYSMIGVPLSKAGYHVYGIDYRGHGLSDGIRGDYKSRRLMASDLKTTIEFVTKTLGHKRLVLLGHSLGVAAVILALHQTMENIVGLALFSAARKFKPNVYPSLNFMDKFKILFSIIFTPKKPVIEYSRDGLQGLDDPLFNFNYTVRFMRLIDARTLKAPAGLNVPVYYAIGDEDELFEIEAAREMYNEIPVDDKEFHVIKGARHAEFPPDSWNDLIKWLDEKFT